MRVFEAILLASFIGAGHAWAQDAAPAPDPETPRAVQAAESAPTPGSVPDPAPETASETASETAPETALERASVPATAETVPAPPAQARPVVAVDPTGALVPPQDPGAFPGFARPPGAPPPPLFQGHGYLALWLSPLADPSPDAARDTFRVRWAVLRVDANPMPDIHVLMRIGFQAPDNPLLDLTGTWAPLDELAVTVGQMRVPFGASATTLAPQLPMLDRPAYVYAMTKATFRDIGVMLHSGDRGMLDGLLHYRFGIFGGGGRLGVTQPRRMDDLGEYLLSARVMLDVGRAVFGGARDRLMLGASYARVQDPAIDTGDPALDRQRASNLLGRTLVAIDLARETQLVGTDLTLSVRDVWAQAELMVLDSVPLGTGMHRTALGASVELAYRLPFEGLPIDLQPAMRLEHFDPDLAIGGDQRTTFAGGLNVLGGRVVRASVYASATALEESGNGRVAAGVDLRATYTF
ncbi:MAG: hypothetical protein IT378_10945 [Sandaracinaceae bacterium]|nr:hypothetical protein [Sandaracinaceae bacterium]